MERSDEEETLKEMARLFVSFLLLISSAMSLKVTVNRRSVLQNGLVVSGAVLATPVLAIEPGSDPQKPIVVVGAGGKTGRIIVEKLSKRGLYVKGVTRSGRDLEIGGSTVTYGSGDVTKPETLDAALQGAGGVIFAASASKGGGDAAHVDYLGVYNTAQATIKNNAGKLVVISSGAVSRPTSIGFKITNVFGRIMDYKVAGEMAMKDAYSKQTGASDGYVIVRPGGLSDNPSEGPAKVEVSQGDVLSAEIGREDVAEITIAALLSNAKDSTIEVYGAGGETLFGMRTGPSKLAKNLPDIPPELIHKDAKSYSQLFDNILSDKQLASISGLVSDYKGRGVESLGSL